MDQIRKLLAIFRMPLRKFTFIRVGHQNRELHERAFLLKSSIYGFKT